MQSNNTEPSAPDVWASVELTPEQKRAWGDTLSALRWKAPAFSHLLYKMLAEAHNKGKADHVAVMNRHHDWAWTDGQNIGINPDNFFALPLMGRVFVLGHEVLHNVYSDVEMMHACRIRDKVTLSDGSTLPWDEEIGQKSADLRLNALLLASGIGDKPTLTRRVELPSGAVHEAGETIGHFDDTMDGTERLVDVYEKEYKKRHSDEDGPGQGGGGAGQGQDPGANPGGFDSALPPGNSTGQSPQQAAGQRDPQAWAVAIQAAATIQKMQGDMPGALQRMFKELLEPEVNWIDYIETLIRRTTGNGNTTWNAPDPWFIGRDIYLPSKTGFGAGHIVVWGDTSGSRSDQEIASNMAELKGILEDVNPARLTVLWGDAAIAYIDECKDAGDLDKIQARGTGGGGGTSFKPVLDWIAEQHEDPELLIGFTDGYVNFPEHEPRYPVIWASSTDHEYPWGKVVRVNKGVPRA